MNEQTQVLQATLEVLSNNPDILVQALNVLKTSEEGQQVLNAIANSQQTGMFKEGGRMAKLAQFGTKVNSNSEETIKKPKTKKGTDGNLIVKKRRNGNYNITSRDRHPLPGEKIYNTERNIPADRVTPEAKAIAERNNWKRLGKK